MSLLLMLIVIKYNKLSQIVFGTFRLFAIALRFNESAVLSSADLNPGYHLLRENFSLDDFSTLVGF